MSIVGHKTPHTCFVKFLLFRETIMYAPTMMRDAPVCLNQCYGAGALTSGWGESFFPPKCPDWLWGSLILHQGPRLRIIGAVPLSFSVISWCSQVQHYFTFTDQKCRMICIQFTN